MKAKDTYLDILLAFKESISPLNHIQFQILKFISKEFTPAKRLYETLILEKLLDQPIISVDELIAYLENNITDFGLENFTNALHHLALKIFTINAGRAEYQPLVKFDNHNVIFLAYEIISHSEFLFIANTKEVLIM